MASAFAQDDYKVRSNLTLNLGVRWEWFPLNYAANGENTNVWVPLIAAVPNSQLGTTKATGTLAGFVVPSNFPFAAFPPPPVGGLFVNNKKTPTANDAPLANFAPRIGLAWKPLASDRLVFRTGFGTFYDRAGNTIYNKSATQGSPYDTPIAQSRHVELVTPTSLRRIAAFQLRESPALRRHWDGRLDSLTPPRESGQTWRSSRPIRSTMFRSPTNGTPTFSMNLRTSGYSSWGM